MDLLFVGDVGAGNIDERVEILTSRLTDVPDKVGDVGVFRR